MSFGDDVRDTERSPAEATAIDRDALTLVLLTAARDLNIDELEVLACVASRLAGAGRRSYGPLELASDSRDFRREALEECADGICYAACGIVKERRARNDADEPRRYCGKDRGS